MVRTLLSRPWLEFSPWLGNRGAAKTKQTKKIHTDIFKVICLQLTFKWFIKTHREKTYVE